jgi:hypothetical protein
VSLFLSRLNHTLTVSALTASSTDEGGQPVYTASQKGTVLGRIDPRVRPEEVNGPDLQPIISDYLAITAIPSFTITERDTIADENGAYAVLGVATLEGSSTAHHLEISLQKITP